MLALPSAGACSESAVAAASIELNHGGGQGIARVAAVSWWKKIDRCP
jgi:hypothetical protein